MESKTVTPKEERIPFETVCILCSLVEPSATARLLQQRQGGWSALSVCLRLFELVSQLVCMLLSNTHIDVFWCMVRFRFCNSMHNAFMSATVKTASLLS